MRKEPGLNPYIFSISAAAILLFVALGIAMPTQMQAWLTGARDSISTNLGWFYILTVSFFLAFIIILAFTPYGRIKLGKDDDEPEFNNFTWFAMLFSAGMGIGLLFFSVAEPIYHFIQPPRADQPGSRQAARDAMTITFFHWGMHAWAIYIVVGMSLAYFAFRHDLPLTIRATLWPLLGRRIHGPIGYAVEIMAVLGTLFGVATSLGLGVMQINAGLEYLNIANIGPGVQLLLIAVITLIATVSVMTGLKVGIRRLSEVNLLLGLALVLFVFLTGPTVIFLSSFTQNVGTYIASLPALSFTTDVLRESYEGADWQRWWTMFYWAWWISWSPFVGMFIARISRGRTIREFILSVLLVPTLLTFAWMTIFGQAALDIEFAFLAAGGVVGEGPISSATLTDDSTALFAMIYHLPVWNWLAWMIPLVAGVAVIVIATYFITSSDSASLVIDILNTNGQPNPPVITRVFWAITEGAVAGVLLYVGGEAALEALQSGAIITALPFSIIMLIMCFSLVLGLRREARKLALQAVRNGDAAPGPVAEQGMEMLQDQPQPQPQTDGWRQRLRDIVQQDASDAKQRYQDPRDISRQRLAEFISDTVLPAFREIQREIKTMGREARIEKHRNQAGITVYHQGQEEFSYAIRGRALQKLSTASPLMPASEDTYALRAEVILPTGPRPDYEITTFSKEGIIEDFLEEYERWWNA